MKPSAGSMILLFALALVSNVVQAQTPPSQKFLTYKIDTKDVWLSVSTTGPAAPKPDSAEHRRIGEVVKEVVTRFGERATVYGVYPGLGDGKIGYCFELKDSNTASKDLAALADYVGKRKGDHLVVLEAGGYNQACGLGEKDLALLAEQPELRDLKLWGCDMGEGVKSLAKMKQLERLELCQCRVSDGRLDFLAQTPNLSALRLDGFPLDVKTLGNLKSLSKLRSLSLDGTNFDDNGAAAIKDLVGLEYLNLNNTKVTDAGTANFTRLVKLVSLGLNDTAVTDKTLESIKDATDLTHLGLNRTKVTGAGFKHLGRMPALFSLGVVETPLNGEELIKHAKAVSGSGRVMINTGGNKLTPEQVKRYADLKQFSEFITPGGGLFAYRPVTPPNISK